MSVWKPVDKTNMSQIVRRKDVEIFKAPSGGYWFRERSAQEMAELRVLEAEHHPSEQRLDDVLKNAAPNNGA
jgi:hypothetical protein